MTNNIKDTPNNSLDKFVDELLTIEEKKKFYIAPKDFRAEYNLSIQLGEATNKLIGYFDKIARGLSRKFPHANKQDQETHIGFAVSEAWRKWRKYDPNVTPSIFAFFTSTIRNDLAYSSNILKKNKHRNISIDGLFINTSEL